MSQCTKQVIDVCRVSENKARDRLGTPETSFSGRKTRTARNVRRSKFVVVSPAGNIVINLRNKFTATIINPAYDLITLHHSLTYLPAPAPRPVA